MVSVIPLFGKAVIPKDRSKTKDSSSQRLVVLHFAMDIDEFCPSPDQATIDRTWLVNPRESTFQVSSQSEYVCSRYDGFSMREISLVRFESIDSTPPTSNPSLWNTSNP